MNILMVTNSFPPESMGGVDTHIYELTRALIKAGHSVRIVARTKNNPAPNNFHGIPVDQVRDPGSHFLFDIKLASTLRRLISAHNINIVHVHMGRRLSACKKLPVPVIFTNHVSSFVRRASKGYWNKLKLRHQLRPAEAILTASEILAEKTRDVGYEGPITYIANGVDTDTFCPGDSSLREQLGIPEDAFVLAVACRLHPVKGVVYLAKAIAELDHPMLHVVVAGDGSERQEIESILEDQIAEGKVHMLGAVDYAAMPSIYRAANASALPSLMEATSIAGLEAMACGLPLIASRVGGLPFIVDDGRTGLLTQPESPQELQQALMKLLESPALVAKMGSAALERVEREFTWRKTAGLVINHYQNLVGNRKD